MIKEVKIVKASGNQLCWFEDEINKLIEEGWQPNGDIKVIKVDRLDILVREMILMEG